MVKLLAECSKCGSPVTDSFETEIEQHGKVKTGSYTNGRWMCHSCIEKEEGKNKNGKLIDDSSSAHIDKCETIGVANESDVSPNTPRAYRTRYSNIDTLWCCRFCRSNTVIVNYRTAIENMHTFTLFD